MSEVESMSLPGSHLEVRDDDSQESNSNSLSPSSRGPGSQREIYQHVSGAGDGHELETSTAKQLPIMEVLRSGAETKTLNSGGDAGDINSKWRRKVKELNDDIMQALKSVSEDDADVIVGRKPIFGHKPVTIEWRPSQKSGDCDKSNVETGIVLYLAVHTRERERGGEAVGAISGVDTAVVSREKSFFRTSAGQDDEEALSERGGRKSNSSSPDTEKEQATRTKKPQQISERTSKGSHKNSSPEPKVSRPEDNGSSVRRKGGKKVKGKGRNATPENQDERGASGAISEVEEAASETEDDFKRQPTVKKVSWKYEDDDEGKEYDMGEDEEDGRRRQSPREQDDFPRSYEAPVGARSRRLESFEDKEIDVETRRGQRDKTGVAKVGNERQILVDVDDDTPSGRQRKKMLQKRKKELKRRRRRQRQLKVGDPFESDWPVPEEGTEGRRTRSLDPKDMRRERIRRMHLELSTDEDSELEEYTRDGDQRHEPCFMPFIGYGDCYDGPVGFLTSKLPDGSSTAGNKTIVVVSRR